MSPFDIINNLSSTSDYKWTDIGDKDYNAFMVNRGMSYFMDCVMHANEMNMRYHTPKELQYTYYHYAIEPKKKRFSKWSTAKKDSEIQLIAEYYNLSTIKAGAIRKIISDQDMEDIKQKMSKGGTK